MPSEKNCHLWNIRAASELLFNCMSVIFEYCLTVESQFLSFSHRAYHFRDTGPSGSVTSSCNNCRVEESLSQARWGPASRPAVTMIPFREITRLLSERRWAPSHFPTIKDLCFQSKLPYESLSGECGSFTLWIGNSNDHRWQGDVMEEFFRSYITSVSSLSRYASGRVRTHQTFPCLACVYIS